MSVGGWRAARTLWAAAAPPEPPLCSRRGRDGTGGMAVAETQVADAELMPQSHGEERQQEDIFSQMDENGIIGMQEASDYYLQCQPRLEEGLERLDEDGEMVDLHGDSGQRGFPHDSVDEDSFNISQFQDSDPVPCSLSTLEDVSHSHLLCDADLLEGDGILSDHDSQSMWNEDEDEEMGECDEGMEQSNGGYRQRAGGAEVHHEAGYQAQAEEPGSGTFGDSWHVYVKAARIRDHGDDLSVPRVRDNADKPADQSPTSTSYSKTQGKGPGLSAHDCYTEDTETLFSPRVECSGEAMERSHDSTGRAGGMRAEGEENPTSFHLNQVLLCRLSAQDSAGEADIEAETIPGSPCSESAGESMGEVTGVACPPGRPDTGSSITRQNGRVRAAQSSRATSNIHARPSQGSCSLSKPLIPTARANSSSQHKAYNLQRRATNQRESTKPLSRKITSETAIYGRGQLNYPLPDFSKVEPRVRFPNEELGQRRPRGPPPAPRRSGPVHHHSPAELVRQVLQSSSDCPPITPTPPGAIANQLQCPQQASEMVYQLQEDYRRLLTKYAEAENTIDRLRIGAKVNLFTDPPQAASSSQGTSLHRASKVMTFAISHPQRAELAPSLDHHTLTGSSSVPEGRDPMEFPGPSGVSRAPGPSESIVEPTAGECLTWALAQQAQAAQEQMDIFEELLKAGKMAPLGQQKAYQQLREDQDALEQAYLQAREEYHSLQWRDTSTSGHCVGTFDPDREVEGNIFRLGMHLEDVKERMEPVPVTSRSTDHQSDEEALPNSWQMRGPAPQPQRPRPLVEPPKPTSHSPADTQHNPKRRLLVPSAALRLGKVDVEVSSVSGDSESEDIIPRTLTHKKMQLEESFDKLLDQCDNFRDLPLSLELNKVGQRRILESPPTPPNIQRLGKEERMEGRRIGASCSDPDTESRKAPELRRPMKMAAMSCGGFKDSRRPGLDGEELVARGRSFASHATPTDSEGAVPMERRDLSPAKSGAGVDGAASPELVPCKTLLRAASGPLEERIVSPETDSGFVGSECSRITPAVHTPEQWPLKRSESHQEPSLDRAAQGPVGAELAVRSQQGGGRGVGEHRMVRGQDRGLRAGTVQPAPPRTSSPHHWAASVISELEQDTFVSHTESEVDGLGAYSRQRYQRSSLTSSPLTFHSKVPYSTSPLNVHSARDQLIQSLQTEVAQLRHRLEQALHKPQGEADGNPPLAVGTTRKHVIHQHSPRRKLPREEEEEEEEGKLYSGHDHSKPFPHYRSELEIKRPSSLQRLSQKAKKEIKKKLAPGKRKEEIMKHLRIEEPTSSVPREQQAMGVGRQRSPHADRALHWYKTHLELQLAIMEEQRRNNKLLEELLEMHCDIKIFIQKINSSLWDLEASRHCQRRCTSDYRHI